MVNKKIVEQQWHIVCGSMEIEELTKYHRVRAWHPRTERHSLFWKIKYPNHEFYKGDWGPELLHFVDEGQYRGTVGKVFCSYHRYMNIQRWFLENLFPA